jgi:lysyl endopeptidase
LCTIFDFLWLLNYVPLHFPFNQVKGPFMSNNNRPQRDFGIFPLEGDELTLEVFVPTVSNVVGIALAPSFKVDSLAHGFRSMFAGKEERSCHINVECHRDVWHDEIRAVAMLLTAGGSRVCTGTFINNVESDGRQLFLTAAHCSTRETYGLMFGYEAPECENSDSGPTDKTIFGMTTLGRYTPSDYHLLEVDLPIPDNYDVFLAGFSAVNTPSSDPTGISHPRGRVKKYAFGKKPVTPDRWSSSEPGDYHWRIANWDSGMTDPGSSGSAMFDEEHRIIGQLHGGTASCSNPSGWDSYGALWASWDAPSGDDKARLYLDPKGTNTLIVDGVDLSKARASK